MDHEKCHDLLEKISDYVTGDLDPEYCAELEKHLRECNNCEIVVNTMRKTVELYQKENTGQEMPDDVKKRLFFKLNLEEFWKE